MSDVPVVLQVPATVHARVLLDLPPAAQVLVVGCHGYGEGAEDMLAVLRRIRGERPWALAAPQALHRFYRRSDGGVVGSWMTRQDRELAIEDNLTYVRSVLATLAARLAWRRLAWVGFSQGVAMAYRAAAGAGAPCHALVALAGDVPPELAGRGVRLPPVLVGRGEADEWYGPERLRADVEALRELAPSAEAVVFPGGHEWSGEIEAAAGAFLDRILTD